MQVGDRSLQNLKLREFWEDQRRAEGYAKRDFLCKPEEVVIERFRQSWKNWSFLDLGVGAGRTTGYFAALMGRYVGSDFATVMVETCRRKYPQYEIVQEDARSLRFESGTFDFVAFSYNGLGDIPEPDIPKALREIARVLKPGGWYFFSQHNLWWAPSIFQVKFSRHPRRLAQSLYRTFKFRRVNRGWRSVTSQDAKVVHDYPFAFDMGVYYIKPEAQRRQLLEHGFRAPMIFRNSNGEEIDAAADTREEPFLHYLAQKA